MQKVMCLSYPPHLVFLYKISLFSHTDRLIFFMDPAAERQVVFLSWSARGENFVEP